MKPYKTVIYSFLLGGLFCLIAQALFGFWNFALTGTPMEFFKGGAVLEQLGVSPEHAMALGDARNDLEMLQLVGSSIAMEDGDPRTIEAADRTTASAEGELRKLLG